MMACTSRGSIFRERTSSGYLKDRRKLCSARNTPSSIRPISQLSRLSAGVAFAGNAGWLISNLIYLPEKDKKDLIKFYEP